MMRSPALFVLKQMEHSECAAALPFDAVQLFP